MGRHVFNHPQDSRAPSCIMVTWEDRVAEHAGN